VRPPVDLLGFTDDDIKFQVHNIKEMVRNIERHGDDDQHNNGELTKYTKMIEDAKKPLYHDCAAQYMRLYFDGETFSVEDEQRME
jgi:hypothetical protein